MKITELRLCTDDMGSSPHAVKHS